MTAALTFAFALLIGAVVYDLNSKPPTGTP